MFRLKILLTSLLYNYLVKMRINECIQKLLTRHTFFQSIQKKILNYGFTVDCLPSGWGLL